MTRSEDWFDDYTDTSEDGDIEEYELTATPNDFNVLTINSFIESGAVKIPGFQRNYVWDIKRASKLIESLILGLPVPQIFLYEEGRNRFLVIDGQQRLMSIHYFIKQRFPRKEKRAELRRIFDEAGKFPAEIMYDDEFFTPFKLSLAERLPGRTNRFRGLNYATLGDYKSQFDLRPIRNVIVKQTSPADDDSSVFEIFNRLNTGGINLRPQEIRVSLYHSAFYDMLYRVNLMPRWRRLVQMPDPDLHMKDVEVLLRGFAMLVKGHEYVPSMSKFLNQFSRMAQHFSGAKITYLETLFCRFLETFDDHPEDIFVSSRTHRFSIALYEAVFTALVRPPLMDDTLNALITSTDAIRALESDPQFVEAAEKAAADRANVERRLQRADALLK